MDFLNPILLAAKSVGVPGQLLFAICAHESGDFKWNYVHSDHGSPSIGMCMVKENTARFLGFKGKADELLDNKTNFHWAAKYLKYQLERYNGDYCKAVGAYNAGKYIVSVKHPGKPMNYRYLELIMEKLGIEDKVKFKCMLPAPFNKPFFIKKEK